MEHRRGKQNQIRRPEPVTVAVGRAQLEQLESFESHTEHFRQLPGSHGRLCTSTNVRCRRLVLAPDARRRPCRVAHAARVESRHLAAPVGGLLCLLQLRRQVGEGPDHGGRQVELGAAAGAERERSLRLVHLELQTAEFQHRLPALRPSSEATLLEMVERREESKGGCERRDGRRPHKLQQRRAAAVAAVQKRQSEAAE
eukprot:69140-Pleurochrysis_carterae.AAC.2